MLVCQQKFVCIYKGGGTISELFSFSPIFYIFFNVLLK